MIFFKRLCNECQKLEAVRHIKSTDEFFDILQKLKRLLSDGNYEYVGGNVPEKTVKQWPQDGLWYRIKCKSCGAIFTLWYDTFGGKGYFKKGKQIPSTNRNPILRSLV